MHTRPAKVAYLVCLLYRCEPLCSALYVLPVFVRVVNESELAEGPLNEGEE